MHRDPPSKAARQGRCLVANRPQTQHQVGPVCSEVDIDAVLDSFIPATNHLKRLAKASEPEMQSAKSLSIGTIAVRDVSDSRQSQGILILCQDLDKHQHLIWYDAGPVSSSPKGMLGQMNEAER